MKKLIFFLFFFTFSNLYALNIKLEKIIGGLENPGVYHSLIVKILYSLKNQEKFIY